MKITKTNIKKLMKKYNINLPIETIIKGVNVEIEHGSINPATNITNDDLDKTFKIAMAHLNERNDYYDKLEKVEGGNLKKDIQKTVRKVSKAIIGNKATKDIERYGDAVLFGKTKVPKQVRDIVRKYNNNVIVSGYVSRAPVQQLITEALNWVSLGTFKKNLKDSPYDKLFHLQIIFTIDNGQKIMFNKNEVIEAVVNPTAPKDAETMDIPLIAPNLTIGEMLNNAKTTLGDKFLIYDSRHANCQDFVLGILNGNNMNSTELTNFIKQDTEQLFKNTGSLSKIARKITDIGAKVNDITTGAGITDFMRQSILHNTNQYAQVYNNPNLSVQSKIDTARIQKKSIEDGIDEVVSMIEKIKKDNMQDEQILYNFNNKVMIPDYANHNKLVPATNYTKHNIEKVERRIKYDTQELRELETFLNELKELQKNIDAGLIRISNSLVNTKIHGAGIKTIHHHIHIY